MAAQTEYEKAHLAYRALAKAALGGDKQAHADKAKAMNGIRDIEREAAREGTILSAQYAGDRVLVKQEQTSSKRSLQEEYVRKFDAEKTVNISRPDQPVKEQTLREYHSKRLLGR
jgi:hypothetical protein